MQKCDLREGSLTKIKLLFGQLSILRHLPDAAICHLLFLFFSHVGIYYSQFIYRDQSRRAAQISLFKIVQQIIRAELQNHIFNMNKPYTVNLSLKWEYTVLQIAHHLYSKDISYTALKGMISMCQDTNIYACMPFPAQHRILNDLGH